MFIALALVHLLPESENQLQDLSKQIGSYLPVSHLLACISFILLLTIEKIIMAPNSQKTSNKHDTVNKMIEEKLLNNNITHSSDSSGT